jgi:hypothetical protein
MNDRLGDTVDRPALKTLVDAAHRDILARLNSVD